MCQYDYRYHHLQLIPIDKDVDYYVCLGRPTYDDLDKLRRTIVVEIENETYDDLVGLVKHMISYDSFVPIWT